MSPEYVRPYVKSQKNDDRDAEAIAEAATRPTMRFVPVKSERQSDIQALHRARERLVVTRTALINHLSALLLERGVVAPTAEYTPPWSASSIGARSANFAGPSGEAGRRRSASAISMSLSDIQRPILVRLVFIMGCLPCSKSYPSRVWDLVGHER